MSLSYENGSNGMVMPVSPMMGGYGYNGMMGGDGIWWMMILFLFAFMGNGWGNGFGNGGAMPYVMNQTTDSSVQRGFDHSAVMNGIQGINTGIAGINTALCNGFAGVNAAVSQGFANAEVADNARQIANMQQAFANQTAMNQGFNSMASQFANCCCENRLGIADLKYTVATENCADRTQSMQNTRDVIDANNRNTQVIIDKLCQLELDGVKNQLAQAQRENSELQNRVNIATFEKSQADQNALFAQGLANEVDALYNRLNNCPVPTTPVYGRTPIFTCPNNGYGCGCNL